MRLILILFNIIWYLHQSEKSNAVHISYISTEYPTITYLNTTIFKYFKVTSLRINRKDPRHYTSVFMENLVTCGNNITMNFYFYEFLTNKYHPSFVEIHSKLCDLIEKEPLFGSQIKKNFEHSNVTCPFPPGQYNLTEMAISFIPKNFPFRRGRIYLNVTYHDKGLTYSVAQTYIDMEIKVMYLREPNVNKVKSP